VILQGHRRQEEEGACSSSGLDFMKLTSFTDYSLRVLIYLAAEPGRRSTIWEIAQAFDVSENHLTKVVHLLGQRSWIETTRGNGGGLQLARPPRRSASERSCATQKAKRCLQSASLLMEVIA